MRVGWGAGRIAARVGEVAALFVPKYLASSSVFGGGAVERHDGLFARGLLKMDRRGDQLFPCPRGPGDEHLDRLAR